MRPKGHFIPKILLDSIKSATNYILGTLKEASSYSHDESGHSHTNGRSLFVFCSKSLFSCLSIDQRLVCLWTKQWPVVVNSVFVYSMLTILFMSYRSIGFCFERSTAAVLFDPTFPITNMRYYRSNALQAELGIAVEREFIALSTF